MKLAIDTTDSGKIIVGLGHRRVVENARALRAQNLLGVIARELARLGKTSKDITAIEVNIGPGSFTGLRVGLAVANALGFALGVPVNGQDIAKTGPVVPKY